MTNLSNVPTLLRADDHEFADITAPPEDINGERALAQGIRPFKFKCYDWDAVQAALDAGAASEAEAKQGLRPHYFEFSIASGCARITVLEGTEGFEERGSANVSVRNGAPRIEAWDEHSESSEMPDAEFTLE
jgi:hypothetical protein